MLLNVPHALLHECVSDYRRLASGLKVYLSACEQNSLAVECSPKSECHFRQKKKGSTLNKDRDVLVMRHITSDCVFVSEVEFIFQPQKRSKS